MLSESEDPLHQLFEGSAGVLLQGKIYIPVIYTLINQWQPEFPRPSYRTAPIKGPMFCIFC